MPGKLSRILSSHAHSYANLHLLAMIDFTKVQMLTRAFNVLTCAIMQRRSRNARHPLAQTVHVLNVLTHMATSGVPQGSCPNKTYMHALHTLLDWGFKKPWVDRVRARSTRTCRNKREVTTAEHIIAYMLYHCCKASAGQILRRRTVLQSV